MSMDINDITYAINGAVFEGNKVLGSGFLEKVYEKALLIELKGRGLKAEGQVGHLFVCCVGGSIRI